MRDRAAGLSSSFGAGPHSPCGLRSRIGARGVDSTAAREPMSSISISPTHEWHLVFANTFQDITFGFLSWFHEAIIGFGSAFLAARFKTVGSISDAVGRDGIE